MKRFLLVAALVGTSACATMPATTVTFVNSWNTVGEYVPNPSGDMLPQIKGDSHKAYLGKLVKLAPVPVAVVKFTDDMLESLGLELPFPARYYWGLNLGTGILLNEDSSPNQMVVILAHEIAHSLQPKEIPLRANAKEGDWFAGTVSYLFAERIGLNTGMTIFQYFKYGLHADADMAEWDMRHQKEIDAAVDYLIQGVAQ